MPHGILGAAFLNAAATAAYIAAVAAFFLYVPDALALGDVEETFFIPMFILLLFVVSAALTGALVLGRPLFWLLDGRRADALRLFAATLGFLAAFAVLALVLMIAAG